jgi:hypothetical protein
MMMIGLLSTAGLAACTDDETPPQQTTTAPTASSTATPSPTLTPPTAPKPRPTPKNAEAFVRYFWKVHNYAYATLDVEPFKAISEPDCTFCSATIEDIRGLLQAGTRTDGSRIRVVIASAPPIKVTTGIIVATVISQDPGRVVRSDGTERRVPAMSKRQAHTSLNWSESKWLVADVAIDKPGKSS